MKYASIKSLDISNGENVGISLFVQGCHFHCYNCFNQDTWDFNGGKKWTEGVENKFLELASRPYIKRVSILGGEPLANENLDEVFNLIDKVHFLVPQKIIWLYTGYTWEQLFTDNDNLKAMWQDRKRRKIILGCNVLVDGRYIDSQRDVSLEWRGSSNQRVIDVQKTLKNGDIVLWKGK